MALSPQINEELSGTGRWSPYLERYRGGEWRDRIFHDLVVEEARGRRRPTILDIGCGHGLDGDMPLQKSLADVAGRYIGIEPDSSITLGDYFTESYRCLFEEAPVASGSVDIAIAVMVLEHLPEPQGFWDKLHDVLADGGVFWGLTVDARHPFSWMSLGLDRAGLKDIYLNLLQGRRGEDRYENYPTHYRSNTPDDLHRLGRAFRQVEAINFSRVGQWGAYFPTFLRPAVDRLDDRAIRKGRPGTLLLVRALK